MIFLCTEKDDWFLDQDRTFWTCWLSNGLVVYQDDYRPNVLPESAWIRLKTYCEENQLSIKRMEIRFRSNCKLVGEGDDGYFFSKGVGAWIGQNTINFYNCGVLNDGKVRIVKWRIPELLEDEVEIRDMKDCLECLIINPAFTQANSC